MRVNLLKSTLVIFGLLLFITAGEAQNQKIEIDRAIYSPTVHTLPSGSLALRASMRFGDMSGAEGGYENFYGLDELKDTYFGLHYGITDRIQIGVSRTKGSGVQRQLVNGELKLHLIEQSDSTNRTPVGIAFSQITTASFQLASRNPESMTYFEDMAHRFSYTSQLIISRRYSSYFALQAIGGYQHRNIAPPAEANGLFFAGLATQVSFSDRWSFLFDGIYPISDYRTRESGFFPVLGAGISYQRPCGDRWVLEFTNSSGLIENDFIPYSQSDIQAGEIRVGLTFIKPFYNKDKSSE